MAAPSANAPFAMQLEVEFLDRLSEPVREGKAESVSGIIRAALERFDLSQVVVVRSPQVIMSVRLPAGIRTALRRAAREKHTSIGQLVRAAVESYLPQLESLTAGQLEMPMAVEQKPAAPEPPAAPRPASRRKRTRAKAKSPAKRPPKSKAKKKPPARKRAKR